MAMFRNALKEGRSLPGSLVDKLIALYPAGDGSTDDDASTLIKVHVDAPSTPTYGHVVVSAGISAAHEGPSAQEGQGMPIGGAHRSVPPTGGGG